jgi:hypothetical protein
LSSFIPGGRLIGVRYVHAEFMIHGPAIGEFVLLADPHLVLEPYLYGCDRREFCADFRHAYCEVFLNACMASAPACSLQVWRSHARSPPSGLDKSCRPIPRAQTPRAAARSDRTPASAPRGGPPRSEPLHDPSEKGFVRSLELGRHTGGRNVDETVRPPARYASGEDHGWVSSGERRARAQAGTAIKRQVPVSDILAVVLQCEGAGFRSCPDRTSDPPRSNGERAVPAIQVARDRSLGIG